MSANQPSINLLANCLFAEDTRNLEAEMRKFWELESIGIKEMEEKVESMNGSIKIVNNMYEQSLPLEDG